MELKNRLTRGLAALGLLGALTLNAWAGYVDNQEVQKQNGDPSPPAAASHINDYINQQDQLNVSPTDGVIKVLRTDQKININDFVTAVFPLHHAPPREMRNVMRQVTGIEGGRAEAMREEKSGLTAIQVIAPRYMIPYLGRAITALDVDWLKEYWDGGVDTYIKMQHRPAAAVDAIAKNYAGDDGFSQIDTTNNAARRFDEEYRIKKYQDATKLIDIPANQVLLDVTVYEVNANNDLKVGLDYINWKNGPGRSLFTFIAAGYDAEQRAKGQTSLYDPFIDARGLVPTRGDVEVLDTAARESYRAVNYLLTSNYVDFLQTKGKARVINSQHLMLSSSVPGTISADQQVVAFINNTDEPGQQANVQPVVLARTNSGALFFDANNNGVLDDDEEPFDTKGAPKKVNVTDSKRSLHYQSAGTVGTKMTVTPYIGLESMELAVDLQQGELNGVAPSGLPIINTRTVKTTVRLLDGQPYVISGLKRLHNLKNTERAPFLGAIPVAGYLFGGETDLKRNNDLVVVIRPHFYLASMAHIAKPVRIDMLEHIVAAEAPMGLPDTRLGYDQWLLGRYANTTFPTGATTTPASLPTGAAATPSTQPDAAPFNPNAPAPTIPPPLDPTVAPPAQVK